jgi:lysyl-tRNA synthetase class 2
MTGWRPASGPLAAASRAALVHRVREYFAAENVLEVDTPALSPFAVSDIQIESLAVTDSVIGGQPLYLHTSPEFCMKRLLAAGYPDIFSICRVFRDGEAGQQHQPEFTMIEWYRLGMSLADIIDDTVSLINNALDDRRPDRPPVIIDYLDAMREICGVDVRTADSVTLADAAGADDDLRASLGDEVDDWLDLLLSTRVIPSFATDRLTVLRHYPSTQAALARLCPDDRAVADRFEVFLGPVELANGYVELVDSAELAARFARDNEGRKLRGRPTRPVDACLLAALDAGLPECAGVAMGFERLQMLYDKTDDIRDVITFAFEPAYD